MAAAKSNMVIEQSATFRLRLVYRDHNKKPINLAGFSAHMSVRDVNGVLLSDLTVANGKVVMGGVTGAIDLHIPSTETALLSFVTALYDIALILPDGTIDRLLEGKMLLSRGQAQ